MRNLSRFTIVGTAIIGALLLPVKCCAQAKCPWLNAATAAGVLGGEVKLSVTPPTNLGDVGCEFSLKSAAGIVALRIEVSTLNDPAYEFPVYRSRSCVGTSFPLRAIGNEAYQCISTITHSGGEDKVIGRVRERAFTLTINRGITSPSTPKTSELNAETRNTAEQIAGGLF